MPARVMQLLVEAAVVAKARKGTAIYEAAQRWEHVGFLVDGALAMFVPGEEERDRLYEHVDPGHFFGIASMFDGEPEMARTVVVSKTATYMLIERARAVELCKEYGALAVAFASTLARRVRHTTSLLAAQINLTAQQRIARYLLGFAEGSGLTRAREPLPLMTQAQIGAAVGTVKEVVGRAVAMFEAQGALRRERGHIHWLNRERLIELANTTSTRL